MDKKHLSNGSWHRRFTDIFPKDPRDDVSTRQVLGALYSKTYPTQVKNPSLVLWSEALSNDLKILHPENDSSSLDLLCGNFLHPEMQPFASRYGGHQFGHWAGQLGDGRVIGLGEWKPSDSSDLFEVQLKGAGPTPYSRQGDGRAVLRSSIREYIASEAMFALGIPTTRALSLSLTGEKVLRDILYDGHPEWEPGAIVCRISPSFLRFGHIELLSACGEMGLNKRLLDFVVTHFYPKIDHKDPDFVSHFFKELCERTANLVAHWMRVGFVHGVLNTDNMSLIGETIDFGPYGWLEAFDPGWTPNTTDFERKRYCFKNQPNICMWNLAQLGQALSPLVTASSMPMLEIGLEIFQKTFHKKFYDSYGRKIGVIALSEKEQQRLINVLWKLLEAAELDMTLYFQSMEQWWRKFVRLEGNAQLHALKNQIIEDIKKLSYAQHLSQGLLEEIRGWISELLESWAQLLQDQKQKDMIDHEGTLFQAENPQIVPRNYLLQEAIDSAYIGDFKPLKKLESALLTPYISSPELEPYQKKRPEWAKNRPGCDMLSCSS